MTADKLAEPRRKFCAHGGESAHKFDRFVRVGALTNRGSHKNRKSVRGGRPPAAGLTSIPEGFRGEGPSPAERRGGRRLRTAVSVPELDLGLSSGRVARGSFDQTTDVHDRLTPPPAYAAAPLSTGAKTYVSQPTAASPYIGASARKKAEPTLVDSASYLRHAESRASLLVLLQRLFLFGDRRAGRRQ